MASCGKVLSRDTDVFVSVNKAAAAQTLGIRLLMVGTTDSTLLHGERLRLYTSLTGVLEDYTSTQEAYKAAREFFAQSPRPESMYIGRVFTAAQKAYGFGRTVTSLAAAFALINDGEFSVTINGDQQDIGPIDLTTATDLDDVATLVQTAIRAVGTGGYTAANFTYNSTLARFELQSGTSGDTSTIAETGLSPVSGGTGTDLSSDSYLAFYNDPGDDTDNLVIVDGYIPVGIADELAKLYSTAAGCLNNRWYGVALTEEFRDAGDPALPANYDIRDAAAWAEANFVFLATVSNDPNVLSSASTDDVAADFYQAGYARSMVEYHNKAAYYPEVSRIARLLAVDYDGVETVITSKFKDMPGVATVPITDAELTVLRAKRCNTMTIMQGGQRVGREGYTSNINWWADERVNLDALDDEIQSRVYTLYLRKGRVGFNAAGKALHYNAIQAACEQFVRNGTITNRTDPTSGALIPAYTINIPDPLELSEGDRAARTWTGITVDVNLTGATHSSLITVNAYV